MKKTEISAKEIENLSANLTYENKKYVIAVGNALLFSQKHHNNISPQNLIPKENMQITMK